MSRVTRQALFSSLLPAKCGLTHNSLTMADYALQSSTDVAAKALDLRAELKAWEKAFAATHQGRKAGREDIKQHPDIGR